MSPGLDSGQDAHDTGGLSDDQSSSMILSLLQAVKLMNFMCSSFEAKGWNMHDIAQDSERKNCYTKPFHIVEPCL